MRHHDANSALQKRLSRRVQELLGATNKIHLWYLIFTLLHSLAVHVGQVPGLHRVMASGLDLESHLFVPPLHSTARRLKPFPQVTVH